jgi:probable phosphoglycerate mutase
MIPLLVIRHGPTDWNAAGLIQGRTDRPLSDAGRAQVAAWRLPQGWRAAECFASPLARALETARLLGLAAVPEPALIEMAWGDWEGRSLAELRAELGPEMAANEQRGLDFRPPGGESPRDVQARLAPLLADLAARGRPAVLVTHKGVLRALYALASGWTMQGPGPAKLRDGCAHRLALRADGSLTVEDLNILLAPA